MKDDVTSNYGETISEKHMDLHGRIICAMTDLPEIAFSHNGKRLSEALEEFSDRVIQLALQAEFLVRGEEWAEYFMTENEWPEASIAEAKAELFEEEVA